MLVVNDIGLLNGLKAVGQLNAGEFHFSNLYMYENYLTVVERQSLKAYAEKGQIVLFESGPDFFDFYASCNEDCPLTMPGLSSLHYALENNMILVTNSLPCKKLAELYGVTVCNCEEAVRGLNMQQAYIEFIMKFVNGTSAA